VWTLVGFLLTLFILSYVLGDNPLFRLAIHLFIGIAAAYASVMVIYQVIIPKLVLPFINGTTDQKLLLLVPLAFSILLGLKLVSRSTSIGSLPLAFLVGVGAGVAIGGAVMGTIVKQAEAAINFIPPPSLATSSVGIYLTLIEGGVMLLGTICSLAYFHFGARSKSGTVRRGAVVEWMAGLGKVFIAVTLGAIFAGVFTAALTALIERIVFIHSIIASIL